MVNLFLQHVKSWLWLAVFGLLLLPLIASSQQSNSEAIKAALSYNFAKYTHWPETSGHEYLTFCYFNSAYRNGFEKLTNKTVAEKKIRLKQVTSVNDTAQCQLIYVDNQDRHKLKRLLLYLDKKPILTVSDMTGFIDDGGMIEIVNQDNKLRFKVNLEQLEQQGLMLSSQVLKLAVQVKQKK